MHYNSILKASFLFCSLTSKNWSRQFRCSNHVFLLVTVTSHAPNLSAFCSERKREALLEEMRTQLVDKGVVLVLEERVRGLRTQLDSSSTQLSSTITELDKEKAKFHSMCRQQEVTLLIK